MEDDIVLTTFRNNLYLSI